jgi:hypothetical protein
VLLLGGIWVSGVCFFDGVASSVVAIWFDVWSGLGTWPGIHLNGEFEFEVGRTDF